MHFESLKKKVQGPWLLSRKTPQIFKKNPENNFYSILMTEFSSRNKKLKEPNQTHHNRIKMTKLFPISMTTPIQAI